MARVVRRKVTEEWVEQDMDEMTDEQLDETDEADDGDEEDGGAPARPWRRR